MTAFSEIFKTADWKSEKHVPVIEAPDVAPKGEMFQVQVTIGKEVAHPNTTEHHIRWIDVHFLPEGANTPYQIGRAEFSAHGESAKGANEGPVYTHHGATLSFKTTEPGTIMASSYCNIHGLWQNERPLKVE
ncbi:MAG: Neelaredoxin [Chitinivibrionales bacterium]|nr:Neelaredoxin [Chitinivibrionales bacterium]